MIDAYLGDAPVYLDPGTSADPAEGSRLSGIFLDGSGCAEAYVGDDLIFAEPGAGNHEMVLEFTEPDLTVWYAVNGEDVREKVEGTVLRKFLPTLTDCEQMFSDTTKLKAVLRFPSTAEVENIRDMFHTCRFDRLDLSGWDVRKVWMAHSPFYSSTIGTLDLSGWKLSSWGSRSTGIYANNIFTTMTVDEIIVEGTDFNDQVVSFVKVNWEGYLVPERRYCRLTGTARNVGRLSFVDSQLEHDGLVMMFEALTGNKTEYAIDLSGVYVSTPLTDEEIAIATSKGYTVTR